ncbi:uncharacterized protein LOC113333802 [Papaver somniferum]|uniref:uncharacterized protein LOC113333802 n=1 Tax=Papaver somniferum TaxID=3469 RepID=UPI000E7009DF|nr:uncharacterized protein LOC113333802 [Papaver somniferum]
MDGAYWSNGYSFQQPQQYDNCPPSMGYNQNQFIGYDAYPRQPYSDFHTYQQQPCSGYVSQAPRENATQANFSNTFSYPTPNRSYDHSPIQREESWEREPIVSNGGKRVNVRKLAKKLYKLEDDGASEELADEISMTIHMELKRRRDKGWETYDDSDFGESENEVEDECNGVIMSKRTRKSPFGAERTKRSVQWRVTLGTSEGYAAKEGASNDVDAHNVLMLKLQQEQEGNWDVEAVVLQLQINCGVLVHREMAAHGVTKNVEMELAERKGSEWLWILGVSAAKRVPGNV